MKLFLTIFLISSVFCAVYGALALYPADKNHPGHCYAKGIGKMEHGEEKFLDNCRKASCFETGDIQVASCGAIESDCGLLPEDLSLQYPDCCPKPKPC